MCPYLYCYIGQYYGSFFLSLVGVTKFYLLTHSVSLTAISRWTWVSQYQNVSILDFIGAKCDAGGGNNWSYKTCSLIAPVSQSVTTNVKPIPSFFYRPDALPVTQPTVSKH